MILETIIREDSDSVSQERLDKTMSRVLSRERGNLNNTASNRTFECVCVCILNIQRFVY